MARFSQKIRLVTTKENFDNCLNVIEYFKVINKVITTEKDKKQIGIINKVAKKFTDFEWFSVEQDRNQGLYNRNYGYTHRIFKNYNHEDKTNTFTAETKIIELIDNTLPLKASIYHLPECIRLNLVRTNNL